jgi:hypothetical protein
VFPEALAWEASYQVWLRRLIRTPDAPLFRELWAGLSWCTAEEKLLAIRVRQAERWLANEARERKRQATMTARRSG